MNKNKPCIILQDMEKRFATPTGSITALSKINLVVNQGEFVVIVGPSGCGKTTLLRILANLDRQSSGKIKILHQNLHQPLTSMVFQEQSVFPWMTVIENVSYGLRLRGMKKKDRYEIADRYISMIGLQDFSSVYPHQLSGGMKQRVSVARAFANDPEILLMDEPFGALDEQNRLILQQELLKIWNQYQKTTVFITHSIDEALVLGDRVVLMSAHPGTIKTIIPVDLPRPREISDLRTSNHYQELFKKIWLLLKEEVVKVNRHTLPHPKGT
ncbi:MAG: ABC transporter ATP-binding protein [Sporomusaceae bacterium]|nr:ABC transporter ATP-binding protein [Sporomusaceae bacterium]